MTAVGKNYGVVASRKDAGSTGRLDVGRVTTIDRLRDSFCDETHRLIHYPQCYGGTQLFYMKEPFRSTAPE